MFLYVAVKTIMCADHVRIEVAIYCIEVFILWCLLKIRHINDF